MLVQSNGIYTDFSLVNDYTLLDVLVIYVLRKCYYMHNIVNFGQNYFVTVISMISAAFVEVS